jgi:hypothetical protein
MDKESLKKNQFWYLLGGSGFLLLILVPVTLFGMAGGADEKKKYDDKKSAVMNAKQPKNASFLPPWQKYQKVFADQKDGVWKKAWDTQKELYAWPSSEIDFNKWMAYPAETVKEMAADDKKKKEASAARREYLLLYAKQFKSSDPRRLDLEKSVAPAVFNGGTTGFETIMGPTMASGGAPGVPVRGIGERPGGAERPPIGFNPGGAGGPGVAEGVAFTAIFPNDSSKGPPLPEEIWILQEDFWVKKEMLRIVREVQQGAARFTAVEVKDDPKVRRFRNGTWEFNLIIDGNKISNDSTLTNVSPSHAALPLGSKESRGLRVQLRQGDGLPFGLEITGEPVAPPTPKKFRELDEKNWGKPVEVKGLDLSKPFDLEQVLDWSNAPVRRIDALRTAKHSHRTAKSSLVPHPAFKPADDATPGGATAKPGAGQPPGGAPGAPGAPAAPIAAPPGGKGDIDPAAAGAVGAGTEIYGLERNRYIIATAQARHLPIGMVLVVEQAHINDVLIAIANSPLRIQATQIAFHDMPLKAPTTGTAEPGGPDQPKVMPPPFSKDERKPIIGPGGPSERPGSQPGTTVEEMDTSLVELTVYGIATLYERYKEKTAEGSPAPGGPQPVTPGTPPGVPPGKP